MSRPDDARWLTAATVAPDEMPAFVAMTPTSARGSAAVRDLTLFEPKTGSRRVVWTDTFRSTFGETVWSPKGIYHGHRQLLRIDPHAGTAVPVSSFPDDSQFGVSILSASSSDLLVANHLYLLPPQAAGTPGRRVSHQLWWFQTANESWRPVAPDLRSMFIRGAVHPHREYAAVVHKLPDAAERVLFVDPGIEGVDVVATGRAIEDIRFSADGAWLAWSSGTGTQAYSRRDHRLEHVCASRIVAWLTDATMIVLDDNTLIEVDVGSGRRERVVGALRDEAASGCRRMRPSPDGRWIGLECRDGISVVDRVAATVWRSPIVADSMAWQPQTCPRFVGAGTA